MIKGFSLLEVLVASAISLSILIVVFTNVTESARHSKKVITNQQRIEAIFHTMDSIRAGPDQMRHAVERSSKVPRFLFI